MRFQSPFESGPDEEIGRLLRDELAGPGADAYLARLRRVLGRLPERDSEWDVLARWTRPGVVAAAMAAAFLLGVTLFGSWFTDRTSGTLANAEMPAAVLMAPTAPDQGPLTFVVLEGR